MPIPNVSNLSQKLHKGSEGGLEFARIITQLLISDSRKEDYSFTQFSDAAGDFKGVDSISIRAGIKTGFQYKFYPSPLSSKHKNFIKASLRLAATKFLEMDKWIIVTPEDLLKWDIEWLEGLKKEHSFEIDHWGHSHIINLILKHPEIGCQYYPELNIQKVVSLSEPSMQDVRNYFLKFINPDSDITFLFVKAQPNLSDCKSVFTSKYYKQVNDIYHLQYREMYDSAFEYYNLKAKEEIVFSITTYGEMKTGISQLPGGMNMVEEKYKCFNPNCKLYTVKFLNKGDTAGTSFNIWAFINNRWVFFPKPWRVIESIENMNSNRNLLRIIRILKFFPLIKRLQREHRSQSIFTITHIVNKLFNKEN